MLDFYETNKKYINKALLILSFILVIYIFLNHLLIYVTPFIIGYVISLILNPFVDYFVKYHKIHRGVCTFILLLLCISLVVVLGTLFVGRIAREAHAFSERIPLYLTDLNSLNDNIQLSIDGLLSFIPYDLRYSFDGILSQLINSSANFLGSTLKNGSLNIVTTIPLIFTNTVLGVVSAFFFTKDKVLIQNAILSRIPNWLYSNILILKKGLFTALSGYIKAQLIIMTIVSSICIIGLSIIQSPYALLVGLCIGIIDALPIFGSGAVLWPWIAYSFLTNNPQQALMLSILYGVVFLTRQMAEPKIVGKQIGLHPLLTLMSIYIGLQVFGIIGLILGPVTVIVIKITMQSQSEVSKPI